MLYRHVAERSLWCSMAAFCCTLAQRWWGRCDVHACTGQANKEHCKQNLHTVDEAGEWFAAVAVQHLFAQAQASDREVAGWLQQSVIRPAQELC